MEIILAFIIYAIISFTFMFLNSKLEEYYSTYDLIFIRGDVRASLGMFAMMSDVEDARKQLNKPNSKF